MPTYGTYATPRADLGMALHEYIYDADRFIGIKAAPIIETQLKAGTFSKLTRESMLLDTDDLRRAPGGTYDKTTYGYEDDTYACQEYGTVEYLDDSERQMWRRDLDAEADRAMVGLNRLLTAQERRWASALINTTTWTGSDLYTDRSATPWATTTTDVIGHVLDAKEKVRSATGLPANAIIMGQSIFESIKNNDGLRETTVFTSRADDAAMASAIGPVFGLPNVLVGGSVYNSATEQATGSITDVWGSTYVMVCRIAETNSPMEPCVARTFLWTDDSASNTVVEQYRDEDRRSDVFRVRQHVDEKVIDAVYGHLIKVA
jgi:hypothetical protein